MEGLVLFPFFNTVPCRDPPLFLLKALFLRLARRLVFYGLSALLNALFLFFGSAPCGVVTPRRPLHTTLNGSHFVRCPEYEMSFFNSFCVELCFFFVATHIHDLDRSARLFQELFPPRPSFPLDPLPVGILNAISWYQSSFFPVSPPAPPRFPPRFPPPVPCPVLFQLQSVLSAGFELQRTPSYHPLFCTMDGFVPFLDLRIRFVKRLPSRARYRGKSPPNPRLPL